MALAVVALLAIAAIGVPIWTGAVARVPVAAPPTAAECRQFHIDLQHERERDEAYRMAREGEARFDGHCFPKR